VGRPISVKSTPWKVHPKPCRKLGGAARSQASLDQVFRDAEAVVRSIDPSTLASLRAVGRKGLPTTVIGLLTHIAEHTQRHVGQAIAAAKLASS
jgi:hypothetical protein